MRSAWITTRSTGAGRARSRAAAADSGSSYRTSRPAAEIASKATTPSAVASARTASTTSRSSAGDRSGARCTSRWINRSRSTDVPGGSAAISSSTRCRSAGAARQDSSGASTLLTLPAGSLVPAREGSRRICIHVVAAHAQPTASAAGQEAVGGLRRDPRCGVARSGRHRGDQPCGARGSRRTPRSARRWCRGPWRVGAGGRCRPRRTSVRRSGRYRRRPGGRTTRHAPPGTGRRPCRPPSRRPGPAPRPGAADGVDGSQRMRPPQRQGDLAGDPHRVAVEPGEQMPFDEVVDQRSGGGLRIDLTERRARGESLEDATAALVQLAERRIDPTPVQPGRQDPGRRDMGRAPPGSTTAVGRPGCRGPVRW